MNDYSAVLIASVVALGLVFALLFVSRLLAPRYRTEAKASIYECGMVPMGQNWSQIRARYYLFAILFVIFDVETVFLYPWAVMFKQVGTLALVEMVIFIAILLFGLVYAWRKGVLQWK
ncbi:MAG: NADH-quinone oxidoreductase subunit A [Chloroflexi bacterium]|nr:NADH-quinone oxidoreductase subunit A [Chloroflexota bacterium]